MICSPRCDLSWRMFHVHLRIFSIDVCHLFHHRMLAIIPLIGGVTDVVVTRTCSGYWAGPPLCSVCHCPVRGGVCFLVVGVELFLSCVSDLRCEVGGFGALPLGEKSLSIPPLEMFTCECALFCHLSPIVWAHRLHCGWHCSWPHLNHGYASNWPWCLSGIVFTRPPVLIHWSQVPGLQ